MAGLFLAQARRAPAAIAVQEGERQKSYGELADRVVRLAGVLRGRGIARGDRVAILSKNRTEYLEVFLACATVGAVVACQNWRLVGPELSHCLSLVEPRLGFVSSQYVEIFRREGRGLDAIVFEEGYEDLLARATPAVPEQLDPEDPLLILYTSGTTGQPKGAVISHRAEIARNLVMRVEFGLSADDAYVCWSPLYHMGGADYSLSTLMSGGKVIVVSGFDKGSLARLVETEAIGWLLLMPGMIPDFAHELESRGIRPRGIKVCGVMADLVPPREIARITRLLQAPFANTFGSTETGCPPCAASLIPIGVEPARLSKEPSRFCELKLVDELDQEVAQGERGEICLRGPTLFSGYFRALEATSNDFRGGFFHMGDVFVRNADGTLDFVDRVKYLIKSGGENVYPAEIERVLKSHASVEEAAVVRRPDPQWGEVPIAFVARNQGVSEEELRKLCRAELAGYKQPKAIVFIEPSAFPRSTSGKIQRHELEKWKAP